MGGCENGHAGRRTHFHDHARVDGLTSLAVLAGALGVWMGFPLADPIAGLAITAAILRIVWQSGKAVFTRLLDGVDPEVVEEIAHAVSRVPGVRGVTGVKVRWLGHRLHAELSVSVCGELSVEERHEIAVGVRHPGKMRPGHVGGAMPMDIPGLGQDSTRRFLRPVVMLLLAEQPMHGYELMGRLKEFGIGEGGMDPSLLYRLLRLLERSGFARSSLDDSGAGPARKVYSLTPEGIEVLDMYAANLDEIAALLRQFKDRYEKLDK